VNALPAVRFRICYTSRICVQLLGFQDRSIGRSRSKLQLNSLSSSFDCRKPSGVSIEDRKAAGVESIACHI
jgi:hypothetical protein